MDNSVAFIMLLILVGFTLNWVAFKIKIALIQLTTKFRVFFLRLKFAVGTLIGLSLLLLFGASAAW